MLFHNLYWIHPHLKAFLVCRVVSGFLPECSWSCPVLFLPQSVRTSTPDQQLWEGRMVQIWVILVAFGLLSLLNNIAVEKILPSRVWKQGQCNRLIADLICGLELRSHKLIIFIRTLQCVSWSLFLCRWHINSQRFTIWWQCRQRHVCKQGLVELQIYTDIIQMWCCHKVWCWQYR